jgi:tryptophan-rich sensory protein
MKKSWKLAISILIPFVASAIGSLFTASSVSTWYVGLQKPVFNPPSWVFGPVWTLLYLLMGIALYLVWAERAKNKKPAFVLFGIQISLNALWSVLFFGLQNPLLAFVEIIFLWVSIVATTALFYRISKPAAYLMIPYILWVSFAAVLNFAIFYLNM